MYLRGKNKNYFQNYFYFELIWILRRILIALFWASGGLTQIITIIVVIMVFLFINFSFQPFIYRTETVLEFITSSALIVELIGFKFISLIDQFASAQSEGTVLVANVDTFHQIENSIISYFVYFSPIFVQFFIIGTFVVSQFFSKYLKSGSQSQTSSLMNFVEER